MSKAGMKKRLKDLWHILTGKPYSLTKTNKYYWGK